VRLVRAELDSELTPFEALRTLRDDERPFALVGQWAGGGAVLGSQPARVAADDADPFALLDDLPEVAGAAPGAEPAAPRAVGGGWFGYLGYSLGARVERLPPAPPRPVAQPAFALAFYDHVLRLDREGRWWFEALRDEGDEDEHPRLDVLRGRMAGAPPPARAYELGEFAARPGRRGHAEAVRWCRRYIAAGDLYQANLCLRLDAPFAGDPLELFATAAGDLAPGYGAYFEGPWGALASLSPELFLRRAGRTVVTAPIKGTNESRAPLVASEKDRAENVMIVDLMRNDLGKSCEYGSVRVTQLAQAKRGAGVWHLVSEVTGELAAGTGDAALVRGCFPPGSVTGAPKIKSMEVIAQLESTAREAYTGAIGYSSPVAGLELNVAIRTFELAQARAWLGAGGGITWGSDPSAEFRECITKARPLIAAAGAELADGDEPEAPLRWAPTRRPRPDPARGVFETVLVVDGEPVLLDEHLERLAASVAELYGEELPPVHLGMPATQAWRVRVGFRPGVGVAVDWLPAAFPSEPLEPEVLVLPGGLGRHKWVDRRLVGGPEPLIVDLSGEVLESGSGNVFVVEGETLVTPPADGRILPGITRAERLRSADVAVEPIDLDRLRAADEVFVTSSIRGRQAVALSRVN
jgi:anthranilate/para-aminobenzoate synthase component I